MKAIRIILLTVLSLLLLLVLVSLVLPGDVHIERTVVVKSTPVKAFRVINRISTWKNWSPWFMADTNMTWNTQGPEEGGKGAGFSWKSEVSDIGEGSVQIIESVPDSFISTEMKFGDAGSAVSNFHIRPEGENIRITWTMDNDGKDIPILMKPLARYFFLMMDRMAGPDFEKGLKLLKEILEADKSIAIGNYEAEVRDFPGMDFIGIRGKLKQEEIGLKLGEFYSQLQQELKRSNANINGVPFTINYSAGNGEFDIEAAIGTLQPLITNAPVKAGRLSNGKWLVVKYFGGYQGIGQVYQKGFEYLQQQKLKPAAAPMEFYFTDQRAEPDTTKWYTEVVFPFSE